MRSTTGISSAYMLDKQGEEIYRYGIRLTSTLSHNTTTSDPCHSGSLAYRLAKDSVSSKLSIGGSPVMNERLFSFVATKYHSFLIFSHFLPCGNITMISFIYQEISSWSWRISRKTVAFWNDPGIHFAGTGEAAGWVEREDRSYEVEGRAGDVWVFWGVGR